MNLSLSICVIFTLSPLLFNTIVANPLIVCPQPELIVMLFVPALLLSSTINTVKLFQDIVKSNNKSTQESVFLLYLIKINFVTVLN